MRRRLTALALAAALVLSGPAALAADLPAVQTFPGYRDVQESDWYYASAAALYERKIMIGDGTGRFHPDQELTLAECAAVAAVTYSLVHGGDGIMEREEGEPWWKTPVTYLSNVANEKSSWTAMALLDNEAPDKTPITRMGFVLLLSLAATKDLLTPVNSISSLPDTSDATVLSFYNAGILSGTDAYGTFHGERTLKRSECAVMAALLIQPSLRPTGLTLLPQAETGPQT